MSSKSEIPDALATLFLYWYGNHAPIRRLLKAEWGNTTSREAIPEELSLVQVEHAWRTRWFAKGDLTAKVDLELAHKFGWLLEEDLLNSWIPRALWGRLALIILWDQVSRNARRGTPQAYAYDERALILAIPLAAKIENLPFQYQATLCICLCHSETSEVQKLLAQCLQRMDGSGVRQGLYDALKEIARKHAERIEMFGHFPERNASLGRKSTNREAAFLLQL